MRASGFLSTPSARRATLIPYDAEKIQRISIHALREEGDAASSEKERPNFFISIHALREEGDAGVNRIFLDIAQFLSTPSARRATWSSGSMMGAMSDFYPRPPRGGRPASAAATVASLEFLSTPSARRATTFHLFITLVTSYFYPRPPRGGRRWQRPRSTLTLKFLSTPSARRATKPQRRQAWRLVYFYPRPPRGGRHGYEEQTSYDKIFLSTPSARRATATFAAAVQDLEKFLSTPSARRATCACNVVQIQLDKISIHALREEGDAQLSGNNREGMQFLSTPSARRATWLRRTLTKRMGDFYPRPPRGGRRTGDARAAKHHSISIHALREEGDLRPEGR